ncbi:PH domain-containing protein [Halobellus rufus]|uniref:PH domain-containing protein n=1 Tax=Halobellus rufus TaxID=1448860 RepID=UPI0009DFD766
MQNSAFSQDALGSVFGYGTVTLEIAGGDDIQLRRIEEPETVRRLVDHATGEDIPGSLEQWHAILDEVRALRQAVESQAL